LSFQEAFNSFDYDNDGQIRVEEFATAIRATGLPVKIADIREMEDQIR
jgi:Ca2+-binding EF-hand superfamily protein